MPLEARLCAAFTGACERGWMAREEGWRDALGACCLRRPHRPTHRQRSLCGQVTDSYCGCVRNDEERLSRMHWSPSCFPLPRIIQFSRTSESDDSESDAEVLESTVTGALRLRFLLP
ncbi:hypothetical protein EYF80_020421 [Liparis tanakae]|uniref:Uncharacterized protein n=1 Tax=Liparis tanakae TaxID=230148 RepID=A0A4Z2HUW3_9TELE|nr:hypothetical protein EYF80_020421 [Liparis tanakae]